MKNTYILLLLITLFFLSCHPETAIEKYGKHYQQHRDFTSLNQVVTLMDLGVDTSYVKSILGEPINMGFDYRYLLDSTGQKGCVVGAVFHIDDAGKIDDKWLDEICE